VSMEETGYVGVCDECGEDVCILVKDGKDKAIVFLCLTCKERLYMEGKEQGYLEGSFDSGGFDFYEE